MPINTNLYKKSKLYDLLLKIVKKQNDENFDVQDNLIKTIDKKHNDILKLLYINKY